MPPAPAETAHERSFIRGALCHVILTLSWTAAPPLLLLGLVVSGAPHGAAGVAAVVGLGGTLISVESHKLRASCCVLIAALAARAPIEARVRALLGAGGVSFLAWMCSKGPFGPFPSMTNFLLRWTRDYYDQIEIRGELSSIRQERSFFAFHPHGCLSVGFSMNGCWNPDFVRRAGKVVFMIDWSLRTKNPFFRWLCDIYGHVEGRALEAGDAAGFRRHMATGSNVAFIPGGFMDAVAYQWGKERTVLRSKKGFIKYCLRYGYRIHPIWTFGEAYSYRAFSGLQQLRFSVAKHNIPMVLFAGWPLFPLAPCRGSRILSYIGAPLELPLIAEPEAKDVDHWHAKYIEALQSVFDANKAEAGYPDAELEIL